MDAVFADDSGQQKTTRPGMGKLLAVGGIHIPSAEVRPLESELDLLCELFDFPAGEEFKWSPDKRMWMYKNLIEERRTEFFAKALNAAERHGAAAIVTIADTGARPAIDTSKSPEEDVVTMLLERLDQHLGSKREQAIVICDRPSGGRKGDDRFLAGCVNTMRAGTAFVSFERIALVVTTDSRLSRLVQLADVVTGCTVSYVGGEENWAPTTFESVRRIVRNDGGRLGGIGVKIHPDGRYANLYHWLFGDSYLKRAGMGRPLPIKGRAYFSSASDPSFS
jgi:Protein of unknown function (DUF3800)